MGCRVLVGCTALLALIAAPAPGLAQAAGSPGADIRVVEFAGVPEPAAFGEVFELRLLLRMPPGTSAVLPDTLVPTDAAASAGAGSWVEQSGPGDSVDVRASYPVVPFRAGRVELPWLALSVGSTGRDGDGAGPDGGEVRRELLLPVGAIQVDPLGEMEEAEGELRPRPFADVLGGALSGWAVAAAALAAVGVGTLAWLAVARLRGAPARPTPPARAPPRRAALHELDRIRAAGLLESGRVREFYDRTSGTLRRYSEQLEPGWSDALTSTELLARMRERWGPTAVESLAPAVLTAERVKFGGLRPGAEVAESDWAAIRSWIRDSPEAG